MSFVLAAGISTAGDALYEIKKTEPKIAVGTTATASLTITAKVSLTPADSTPTSSERRLTLKR